MRGGIVGRWLIMVVAMLAFLGVAVPAQAMLSLTPAFRGGSVELPMYVTSPPGDSHRLFIVTRPGVIYVAVDGKLQSPPFLDISSQVWSDPNTEAAMGSMAFDPGYENPASAGYGRFYVYFSGPPTGTDEGGPLHIDEFTADPAHTPDVANPNSEREVLTIPHGQQPFHYGGTLQFNPNDHLLYIATGDAED